MVWILTHIGESEPEIPLLVRFVLLLFIGIGIFSVESMIDIVLGLQLSPEFMGQAHILTLLGYTILFMLFALLLSFEYLGIILRRNRVLEQQRQLALIEQQQYQLIVSTAESLSDWKHDYQGQMRLISALIAEEKYAELQQFTSRMDEQFNSTASLIYTGNRTIDCVISLRMMDAKRHQIPFETKLYLPKQFHFDEVAFSSLIGNILDNAIEACLKVPADLKKIYFELKPVKKMLYLYCSNASDGHYLCGEQEMLRSTKKEKGHGIGLRRIRDIVEDAGGTIQFLPEESQFSVRIMIPLTEGLDENCNCRK
jgi:sensor histidine kinase regulating citrate/malate metabolism